MKDNKDIRGLIIYESGHQISSAFSLPLFFFFFQLGKERQGRQVR